jgi:hypothetical protein
MTTTTTPQLLAPEQLRRLSQGIVAFLETNTAPEGLLQPDVFADVTLPQWRLQTKTADDLVRLRRENHPALGRVVRWHADPIPDGLVFEFEERWTDAQGEQWYARELIRARVRDGRIAEMSVYCTGDWSRQRQAEHAQAVKLLRP